MNHLKFSIIIPTHNRPELLAVVVKHAMQVDYPNFEVIVSDNSGTEALKRSNDKVLEEYTSKDNFRLVRPAHLMSPPEHFEFALDFASGDYVLYLTDKMMILPHILWLAADAIATSDAEIVNWASAPYEIHDAKNPSGPGTLTEYNEFLYGSAKTYNPKVALEFKASSRVPRDMQHTRDYVVGKIIFGCYSKDLIKRIRDNSGMVFGGVTHDYSAMIQALSLAKSCVMLNAYGILFITLPLDQSWGSLINTYSQQALNYYKSFADVDLVSSLPVPGLYASQHNMVAYDYIKFMPLYRNMGLFNELNWLLAIYTDVVSESKVWGDSVERDQQVALCLNEIRARRKYSQLQILRLSNSVSSLYRRVRNHLMSRFAGTSAALENMPVSQTSLMKSLIEAMQQVSGNSRASKKYQILCLYNANQTYTETVFEHLNAFQLHSVFRWSYLHFEDLKHSEIDLQAFDTIVVHYTIRLPFDEIGAEISEKLVKYPGIKILFIQDEYDNTSRTKYWIKTIGFNVVFSVVPEKNLKAVYGPEEFPLVRFVSVLTGYIPGSLLQQKPIGFIPPSRRSLVVGYRGRPLPIRYGLLGQEKVLIGKMVKEYCLQTGISQDIAWSEESRIYGENWYKFIGSCKAMLGTESGSNVFDWDGTLSQLIDSYRKEHPDATEQDVYQDLIAPQEMPGLMNQVSPRVFEAIVCRTVLVLFEGNYSGVISPWVHFIPLKKDGSNLNEVFEKLHDDHFVDGLVERAYQDVVVLGKYSYRDLVHIVDKVIETNIESQSKNRKNAGRHIFKVEYERIHTSITTGPLRPYRAWWDNRINQKLWLMTPAILKTTLKPALKKILIK